MFGNTSRGGSQKYTPLPLHGKNDKRRNGYNNYSDSDSDSEEDDFIQNQIKSQQVRCQTIFLPLFYTFVLIFDFFSRYPLLPESFLLPVCCLVDGINLITKTQMRKQDEGLEMLSQSAERLGKLSLNINEELNSQNK